MIICMMLFLIIAEKVVKDQEIVAVLHIIEEATKAAKEV